MSMDLMIKKIIEMNSPVVAGLDPKLDYVPAYIQTECFAEYGETAEGAARGASCALTRRSLMSCARWCRRSRCRRRTMRCTESRA